MQYLSEMNFLNFFVYFSFNIIWIERQVREFLKRFATIPDLLELDHLTVSGDVTFGRHVSLKASFK
jgi:hypothetical protein